MFIGFVKFEASKINFVFGLAQLPTETARVFFPSHSLKKPAFSYFFLLFVPVQCLDKTFLYFFFSCATFLFLPHFDVICDLLLNRRTATWNLFVNYNAVNLVPRVLSLPTSRKYPGCGWSRVYVYKSNPHRGWVFDLIVSKLSMEEKVALPHRRYFES